MFVVDYILIIIIGIIGLAGFTWAVSVLWPTRFDEYYLSYFHIREVGSLEAFSPHGSPVMIVKQNRFPGEPEEPDCYTKELMRREALYIGEHKYGLKTPIQSREIDTNGAPLEDWR